MRGPLVNHKNLRLAMLGMVEGNGHPYSWSAMFNGYDPEAMKHCPYPGIPEYLNKEPKDTLQILDARVTHIWTDDPSDAQSVARASLIPNIVERPEDVIGEVDAVIIATDIPGEHVDRCRPFVERGIPVFVDKPLTDNEADLAIFSRWVKEGKAILSSSCMRYAKEYIPYQLSTSNLGQVRYASITMPKAWERYGIHALEALYPIFGPGFLSVRNFGTGGRNIVHLKHAREVDMVIANISDLYGAFGTLQLSGTVSSVTVSFHDTFFAFKSQLQAFVDYVRSGELPFPYEETEELIKLVIAGKRSAEEGGREVLLDEIKIAE